MTARSRGRARRRAAERTPPRDATARPPIEQRLGLAIRAHAPIIAFALVALHLLFAWLSFMPTPHTGGDNAAYIALARSLLDGSYSNIYDPLSPPHTQYPPGFPAILAIAMLAGLQPWVPLKVLMIAFSAAGVAFSFQWIRRRGRPLLALAVGLLLAISPGVLELGHWILSDVPFWAITMIALWAFERLPPGDRRRLGIAIAATVLAYFTRSAGLPLVIAAFAWLALRRRWHQLGALAAVIVPLAFLWWLRTRTTGDAGYASQFWSVDPYDPSLGRIGAADLVARFGDNLSRYVRVHMPILLVGETGGFRFVLSLTVIGLAVAGWVRQLLRRRIGVVELYLPLYMGLLFIWPAVWSGERFLLPALPLILLYAGMTLHWLASRTRPGAGLAAGLTVSAGIVLLQAPGIQAQFSAGSQCTMLYRMGDPYACLAPEWRDYFDVAEWSERHLPEDAAVITRKPRLWWGLSNLQAIIYPFSTDAATFFAEADRVGAQYLVLDHVGGTTQTYVVPIVLRRMTGFCLMHATQIGTAVMGILPSAATLPDEDAPAGAATFAVCPEEYWRDPADREAAMRGLGVTR